MISLCVTAFKYRVVMESIPFLSVEQIVDSSGIVFQGLIRELTNDQKAYYNDVRRKGRNKLATRRLRKKKVDLIEELTKKLCEKRKVGKDWETRLERALVVRDRMAAKILLVHGLNNQTHVVEINGDQIRINARSENRGGSFVVQRHDDLQENSVEEEKDEEWWLEFCKQHNL